MTAEPETPSNPEPEVEDSFDRIVGEGRARLTRPWLTQLGTGLLGGVDVGTGMIAYLVILHRTDNELLAALGFGIGFVALLLAHSELFTENFLVPVTAVAAKDGSIAQLLTLWAISLATNLLGGLGMTWLVILGAPELGPTAISVGQHYIDLGLTGSSFASAVLAGLVITLLTRMQNSTEQLGVQVIPAYLFGSLLVGAQLFHSVIDSMFIFAGIFAGASYGFGQWAPLAGWAAAGNIVGGLGLVTALRLLRVRHRVAAARRHGGEPGEESGKAAAQDEGKPQPAAT